ncbi:hypothetical protein SCMU_04150 [Sinomonas cyclohexanicum]|uniref:Uncharacterized protein n=1 Tax=Sinomonas cyclohexanicum TaxID=322009 RepID=A0ABN6FFH3_SINCY|nr:hypothetical protein [Corynebacterium cyclohexanicum]BCT74573.1 hypothetical protein SCMU_04150 [Corynebacterium cyclohexanicum]
MTLPDSAGGHVPAPPSHPPGRALAGLNRVSTQALTSLARAAAAAELGVRPADVRADWTDDAGLLALRVVAPIVIPDLADAGSDAARLSAWGGSVWERCAVAKGRILDSVMQLSGATLSRVDLRISGMRAGRPMRPLVPRGEATHV